MPRLDGVQEICNNYPLYCEIRVNCSEKNQGREMFFQDVAAIENKLFLNAFGCAMQLMAFTNRTDFSIFTISQTR